MSTMRKRRPRAEPMAMPMICVVVRRGAAAGAGAKDGVGRAEFVGMPPDIVIIMVVSDSEGMSEVEDCDVDEVREVVELVGEGGSEEVCEPVEVVTSVEVPSVGTAVGGAVEGMDPAGTKTVVVTKTVVIAFGATNVVENTVLVMVAKTALGRKTVVKNSAVTVDVTICSCLLTFASSAKSPIDRLPCRKKEVAVTVAVCVLSVGFCMVMTRVLVVVTRDVVGAPVNTVTVLVRVCVMKIVEASAASIPVGVDEALLWLVYGPKHAKFNLQKRRRTGAAARSTICTEAADRALVAAIEAAVAGWAACRAWWASRSTTVRLRARKPLPRLLPDAQPPPPRACRRPSPRVVLWCVVARRWLTSRYLNLHAWNRRIAIIERRSCGGECQEEGSQTP